MTPRDDGPVRPARSASPDGAATSASAAAEPPPTGMEGLLAALVAACQCLVAHSDAMDGLKAAMAPLGRLSGHDRAYVWQLVDDGQACELVAEWHAPGVSGFEALAGTTRFQVDDCPEVWLAMRAGEPYPSTTLARTRTHAALNANVPNRSDVMVPIMLEGTCWGCIGFDNCNEERRYSDAEIQVLRGAAAAIAAALSRSQAEARRLEVQRQRTAEAQALNVLTQGVVRATRVLLEGDDFRQGVQPWLGHLGLAAGADAAMLVDIVGGQPVDGILGDWQHAWRRDGQPFSAPPVPSTTDFDDWLARLLDQQAVWADIDDLVDPASVTYWQATDCATNLLVPVVVGGIVRFTLCFDWRQRHEHSPAAEAVLRTAAECLSAVLQRQAADDALLTEREARLRAEQQRSTELARANAALRQALDGLAGTDGEAAFLRGALVQLQLATKALAAFLFRSDDDDGRLHLVGRAAQGRFSDQPQPDDPPFFSRPFAMTPALMATLRPLGGFLWRRVDPDTPITENTPESTRWHVQMGHAANAVHALMVGPRQVGFIGLVFDTPVPLTQAELDLAHALTQPITLALELARLSRLARRSSEQTAMLNERNRLAREIHDGIAQAFLAIRMQLDPLADSQPALAPVQRALALARHGLTEARRAVAALRPQGLQDGDLPTAIGQLLTRTREQTGVACSLMRPPRWQPLPDLVEDHFFRIVQEAVHNALQHGHPGSIRVELSQAAGETTVLVADDGAGFDIERLASNRGFGLESMQQRAQLVGARIDLLSQPGKGTQVLLSWMPSSADPGRDPAAQQATA